MNQTTYIHTIIAIVHSLEAEADQLKLDCKEFSLFLSPGRKPLGIAKLTALKRGTPLPELLCYTEASEIQQGPTRRKNVSLREVSVVSAWWEFRELYWPRLSNRLSCILENFIMTTEI